MQCPYCQATPTDAGISGIRLHICTQCGASFIPASQWVALRRKIPDQSRRYWAESLKPHIQKFPSRSAPVCAEHGQPLIPGVLPNFKIEAPLASCCDLWHLPPELMARMLTVGLNSSTTSSGSLTSEKHTRGMSRQWGGFFFNLFGKKTMEDVNFDDILWETKLKPLVTGK